MKAQYEEKMKTLREEIRTGGVYRKIEGGMMKRIEQIHKEYTELLKEGIRMLPARERMKIVRRILIVKRDYIIFRFNWILVKAWRLFLGLDL